MIEAEQLNILRTTSPISYEQQAAIEAQAQAQPALVQVQSFTAVMSGIMAVWMAAYVLQQIIKGFKGETIKRPPLLESSSSSNPRSNPKQQCEYYVGRGKQCSKDADTTIEIKGETVHLCMEHKVLIQRMIDRKESLYMLLGEIKGTQALALKAEGERIAEQIGCKYEGDQYVDNEFQFHYFTDPKTGTTIAASNLEEAREKLKESRETFGVD